MKKMNLQIFARELKSCFFADENCLLEVGEESFGRGQGD
jgi:hypothetical protein